MNIGRSRQADGRPAERRAPPREALAIDHAEAIEPAVVGGVERSKLLRVRGRLAGGGPVAHRALLIVRGRRASGPAPRTTRPLPPRSRAPPPSAPARGAEAAPPRPGPHARARRGPSLFGRTPFVSATTADQAEIAATSAPRTMPWDAARAGSGRRRRRRDDQHRLARRRAPEALEHGARLGGIGRSGDQSQGHGRALKGRAPTRRCDVFVTALFACGTQLDGCTGAVCDSSCEADGPLPRIRISYGSLRDAAPPSAHGSHGRRSRAGRQPRRDRRERGPLRHLDPRVRRRRVPRVDAVLVEPRRPSGLTGIAGRVGAGFAAFWRVLVGRSDEAEAARARSACATRRGACEPSV